MNQISKQIEMEAATIGMLILAAGGSTRLGKPKQLLQYQGQSFLRHTVTVGLASGCQTVVVLGAQAEQLRSQVSDLPVAIVENWAWVNGISTSIKVGLEALQNQQSQILEAAIITLCDQPFISTPLIKQLIERYKVTGKRIVASQYAGIIGVPALFDLTLFPDLMLLQGDVGAKALIQRLRHEVITVSFPDGAIDIDTLQDYEQFLQVVAI